MMDEGLNGLFESGKSSRNIADRLLAFSESGELPTREKLVELARHNDIYLRSAVAIILGEIKERFAYSILTDLLQDKECGIREYAVLSMGKNGDSRNLFCLVNYFANAPHRIKMKVLMAMKELGDPRSRPFLESLKTDVSELDALRLEALAVQNTDFAYRYHGSDESLANACISSGGTVIRYYNDLENLMPKILEDAKSWSDDRPQTYVVNQRREFVLGGDIHEHVLVAKGEDVLAAGEACLTSREGKWVVGDINNRSNGYYPADSTFLLVDASLTNAGIEHPDIFTETFPLRGYFDEDFLSLQPFYRFHGREQCLV